MADPAAAADHDTGSRPWLAFAACAAIWGTTFLAISIGNDALAPVWASAVRLVLASALLFLWCLIRRIPLPRGEALKASLWFGALNFGLNMPLLYWGEARAPSGLSAVMFSTVPLTTSLLARAFGMEELQPRRVLGAVIALGGVALLFSGSLTGKLSFPGLAAVFASAPTAHATAFAAIALWRGPRLYIVEPTAAIVADAVACAVGAAFALTGSLLLHESHALPPTAAAWFPLIYLTLAGSLGAFVIYTWLVNHWPLSRASYLGVVVPLIAMFAGTLVRHEPVTASILGGSALVLAGLVTGMR